MVQHCIVPLCKNNAKKKGISFFSFPKQENIRKKWLVKIRRDERKNPAVSDTMRVCSAHFLDTDFVYSKNGKRRCLRKDSVPSVFAFTSPRKLKCRRVLIRNKSTPSKPLSNIGELFNQWKEALKETETELTWDDHICEHHFLENDIERYHRTKAPGGDIVEIQKKLPTLKSDAVPIKFLKPSSHPITKDSSNELQSASQNSFVLNSERNLCDNSNLTLNSFDSVECTVDSEIEMCYESSVNSLANLGDSSIKYVPEHISHKTKCLLYSELVKSIQLVKKPSKFWSVVCTDQFTVFARWNNEFIAEKRLVIESSFTIRVFLKDWEIEMTDLVDITSFDEVSSLLEKVENYNMDLRC